MSATWKGKAFTTVRDIVRNIENATTNPQLTYDLVLFQNIT